MTFEYKIVPEKVINSDELKEYLPHREPFLVIDRVLDYEPGEYLIAKKNITVSESCFRGHFPQKSIYPGVLIVEGMAQASAMLCYLTLNLKDPSYPVYFMSLDNCKFRAPVTPGDSIIFKVQPINIKTTIVKMQAYAYVDSVLVSEATLVAMLHGNKNEK